MNEATSYLTNYALNNGGTEGEAETLYEICCDVAAGHETGGVYRCGSALIRIASDGTWEPVENRNQRDGYTKMETDEMFYRINSDGNADILDRESGESVTRIDANVYPVGSTLSARHEHAAGITLTVDDARAAGIASEHEAA